MRFLSRTLGSCVEDVTHANDLCLHCVLCRVVQALGGHLSPQTEGTQQAIAGVIACKRKLPISTNWTICKQQQRLTALASRLDIARSATGAAALALDVSAGNAYRYPIVI